VALPRIATAWGVPAVFATLALTCLVAAAAVAIWVREPPGRPARGTRRATSTRTVLADPRLLRLSLSGLMLVVPQYLGSVFLVEVLHDGKGFSIGLASGLLALTQVLGALGRLGNGFWSDRVASRLGPLRSIAVASAVGFGLAAALQPGPTPLLAGVLVPGAALAISWNGLVTTAAGELAPPDRAATAMAVSSTAIFVGATAAPALGGLVAEAAGLPVMLAMGGAAALGAFVLLFRLADPAARPSTGS
jgi:predicted MFS family arabinose efflux permease